MGIIYSIDYSILMFLQEHIRNDILTGIFKFITMLGNGGWFWIVLSLLLLINKQTRKIGLTAIIALIIGALITNVCLKNMVARIRPYDRYSDIIPLIAKPKDFSFPSGHSCASFAAAFVYFKLMPKEFGIPTIILASLIAFSRLYIGVHYPTDVLFGILIGIFSAYMAVIIYKKYLNRNETIDIRNR